jgi:hypothetical protein
MPLGKRFAAGPQKAARTNPQGRERYATPGAARSRAVFREWNTPKKSLRRSNLQSLDARDFFFFTSIWHKRCSR